MIKKWLFTHKGIELCFSNIEKLLILSLNIYYLYFLIKVILMIIGHYNDGTHTAMMQDGELLFNVGCGMAILLIEQSMKLSKLVKIIKARK
jgi:hypothetical protein